MSKLTLLVVSLLFAVGCGTKVSTPPPVTPEPPGPNAECPSHTCGGNGTQLTGLRASEAVTAASVKLVTLPDGSNVTVR